MIFPPMSLHRVNLVPRVFHLPVNEVDTEFAPRASWGLSSASEKVSSKFIIVVSRALFLSFFHVYVKRGTYWSLQEPTRNPPEPQKKYDFNRRSRSLFNWEFIKTKNGISTIIINWWWILQYKKGLIIRFQWKKDGNRTAPSSILPIFCLASVV